MPKSIRGGEKYVVGLMFLLLGLMYSVMEEKPLPMSLDASVIASSFIICGDCYMKHKSQLLRLSSKYWFVWLLFAFCAAYYNYNNVEMYEMRYGNWFCFVVSSLSSILLVCFLCQKCKGNKTVLNVVAKYGKLSLLVFATHYYCLFVPITLKNHIVTTPNIMADYIYWFGSIAFALILVLPISIFINNKAKWLIGK